MQARTKFLAKIDAIELALSEPVLADGLLTDTAHNARAQVLRNGLMVVGFAALEDFLKERTGELLESISKGRTRFSDLPIKVQQAATVNVARSLKHLVTVWKNRGMDPLAEIQNVSAHMASTSTTPYLLSPYSFGWEKSNLGASDVAMLMKSLCVRNPWGEIDRVAIRLGRSGPPKRDEFEAMALGRHRAAHSASATTHYGDVGNLVANGLAIGAAFDTLVSHAAAKVKDGDEEYLINDRKTSAADVSLRFVAPSKDGGWRETREGQARARRKLKDKEALILEATIRSKRKLESLIVLNAAGQVVWWDVPYA